MMRKSFTAFVAIFLIAGGVQTAAGQSSPGGLRGHALDNSGARLPGVTVVATSSNGRLLGVTTTDDEGAYRFAGIPSGPIDLSFQLSGFTDRRMRVVAQPGLEADVVGQLELASLSETVVVRADEPPPPPKSARPALEPVVSHDRDAVCGPAKAGVISMAIGSIIAGNQSSRGMFAPGDQVAIKGGTETGLEVGRNVVVRRFYDIDGSRGARKLTGEHTAGLLQVVSARERDSLAVVVYACDEMLTGDFVAPFEPQPVRRPEPPGEPNFERAAKILFADDRQMVGAPRRMVVIDQGADNGVYPGGRMTLFSRAKPDASPTIVGEAVVVAVRDDSATIRVETATTAIYFGDFAAPQGPVRSADAQGSQGAR